MLSSELKARQAKLLAEQKARTDRERQKLEKERLLKERARQRALQREEDARQKRLAEQAAAETEREQHEAEVEHNRGVYYRDTLRAVAVNEEVAAAMGVRRAADKVLLPSSVSRLLLDQDAPKNGAMLFEITTPFGTKTCAGVLEFTAAEGVVALPSKVVHSLYGMEGQPQGRVEVRYKRLEKGTYVRLQPQARSFHEEVGGDMKAVLEEALHKVCTLSEGDWLQIDHAGITYNLKVLELQPDRQVSIIDTDIEADVGPSMESEERVRQAEEEAARQAAFMQQLQEEREAEAARLAEEAVSQQQAAAAAAEAEAARRERIQQEKAASLPPEVSPDDPSPHTTCVFRLPDGARISRIFRLTDPVQQLFDFVDSQGAGGLEPGGYSLVMQFPRRVVEAGSGGSLGEAGIAPGQEVFMLEKAHS